MGTTGWRRGRLSHLCFALLGDETFLFCGGWWVFLFGGWFLCFVWVCCFGSVFVFELSHSLLFTQNPLQYNRW